MADLVGVRSALSSVQCSTLTDDKVRMLCILCYSCSVIVVFECNLNPFYRC